MWKEIIHRFRAVIAFKAEKMKPCSECPWANPEAFSGKYKTSPSSIEKHKKILMKMDEPHGCHVKAPDKWEKYEPHEVCIGHKLALEENAKKNI